jgi:hypothetical protein
MRRAGSARFQVALTFQGGLMKFKRFLVLGALAPAVLLSTVGCGESTEVPLKTAPAVSAPPPTSIPKEPQKGGGAGSSGNMNRNPGAST